MGLNKQVGMLFGKIMKILSKYQGKKPNVFIDNVKDFRQFLQHLKSAYDRTFHEEEYEYAYILEKIFQ